MYVIPKKSLVVITLQKARNIIKYLYWTTSFSPVLVSTNFWENYQDLRGFALFTSFIIARQVENRLLSLSVETMLVRDSETEPKQQSWGPLNQNNKLKEAEMLQRACLHFVK